MLTKYGVQSAQETVNDPSLDVTELEYTVVSRCVNIAEVLPIKTSAVMFVFEELRNHFLDVRLLKMFAQGLVESDRRRNKIVRAKSKQLTDAEKIFLKLLVHKKGVGSLSELLYFRLPKKSDVLCNCVESHLELNACLDVWQLYMRRFRRLVLCLVDSPLISHAQLLCFRLLHQGRHQ